MYYNDYLMHKDHKYTERKWKNGHWVYTYPATNVYRGAIRKVPRPSINTKGIKEKVDNDIREKREAAYKAYNSYNDSRANVAKGVMSKIPVPNMNSFAKAANDAIRKKKNEEHKAARQRRRVKRGYSAVRSILSGVIQGSAKTHQSRQTQRRV